MSELPYSDREITIMQLQLWGETKRRRNHEYLDIETAMESFGFAFGGDGLREREDIDA